MVNRVLLVQSNKSEVLNDWLGERKNHERNQHSVYEQPYANDVSEDDQWNDPKVQPEEAPNQDSFGNREYTDQSNRKTSIKLKQSRRYLHNFEVQTIVEVDVDFI